MDFAGSVDESSFLIIVDGDFKMKIFTPSDTIKRLGNVFAIFGLTKIVVLDKGTQLPKD